MRQELNRVSEASLKGIREEVLEIELRAAQRLVVLLTIGSMNDSPQIAPTLENVVQKEPPDEPALFREREHMHEPVMGFRR